MKKVLHIAPDDNKFVWKALDLFDSIPELKNICWVISKTGRTPIKFIDNRCAGASYNEFLTDCCLSAQYDIIVLHCLQSLPFYLIGDINPQIKVIWLAWGKDIYDGLYPQFPLIPLKNKIKSDYMQYLISTYFNKQYIKSLLFFFIKSKLRPKAKFKKAIKRIDYFSGVFPSEYVEMKKNSIFKAKQLEFNYVGKNTFFNSDNLNLNLNSARNSILVGHSGYALLNHNHAFKMLKRLNLRNLDIITPLNYSPSGDYYKKRVLHKGYILFGNKFHPLTDFIPYDDYVAKLRSVRIAIFDIDRQCGVGNCLISIWNGAKVFFPKTSINYSFFLSIGVKIFSIEEDLTQSSIDCELSESEIIKNREAIINHLSYNNVRARFVKSLVCNHLI